MRFPVRSCVSDDGTIWTPSVFVELVVGVRRLALVLVLLRLLLLHGRRLPLVIGLGGVGLGSIGCCGIGCCTLVAAALAVVTRVFVGGLVVGLGGIGRSTAAIGRAVGRRRRILGG